MKKITKKILPIVLALGVSVSGCSTIIDEALREEVRGNYRNRTSYNDPRTALRRGKIPGKCSIWLTNDYDDLRTRPENAVRFKGYWEAAPGYKWSDPYDENNVCTMKIN